MPIVRLDRESMYKPSDRGFVETIGSKRQGIITEVTAMYHQWQANKQTGAQVDPLTAVFITIQPVNADGLNNGDPVDQELVAEWGAKDGSLIKIRPAAMSGPE